MKVYETINMLSMLVFMGWLHYVASLMPSRGHWPVRLLTWALALGCAINAASPFYDVQKIAWHGAWIHACGAVWLLLLRTRVAMFLRSCFQPDGNPLRRASDWT